MQSSSSSTSTTCSTPPPHDIHTLILSEQFRYKRKGYGLIWACLMVLFFFMLAPQIGQLCWPMVLKVMDEYSIPDWKMLLFLASAMGLSFVIFSNLIMWGIYHCESPFFERYKINPEPWPWHENKEEWLALLRKSIKLVLFNNMVVLPLTFLTIIFLHNWNACASFRLEDLPDSKTLVCSIIFCMFAEDFIFYYSHRTLHHPKLYPYIHKVHHTYSTTIGIAGEYAHPIEFIFGNLIPLHAGPYILGKNCHMFTFLIWALVRLGENIDAHCGYEFSWSPYRLLPFATSSAYHAFHHSHNVGNYSSFFSIWDTFFGTNKAFFQYYDKMNQAKEKYLKRQQEFETSLMEKLEQEKLKQN